MNASGTTFVIASSECTVMTGTVQSVLRAGHALARRAPRLMLLHVRRWQAPCDGGRPTVASYLLSEPSARIPAPGDSPVLAVTVPQSRVAGSALPAVMRVPSTPLVRASRSLLRTLQRDPALEHDDDAGGVEHVVLSLMRALVHEQRHAQVDGADGPGLAERLETFIDARHRDPLLDVDAIARELHFSRRQLYRFARGDGVAAMLAERRLTTACALLRERPDLSINEVALMSGFTSASRLRVHVMRRHGMTPSEYRDGTALDATV